MSRIVYLNGQFLPEAEARISVFDRGFTFADAVYEVTAVVGGKLVDYAGHAARLKRSLGELGIRMPCNDAEMLALHRQMPAYARQQREKRWEQRPQPFARERRIGVLGFGDLGSAVASSLKRFGFDVAAWSRRPRLPAPCTR